MLFVTLLSPETISQVFYFFYFGQQGKRLQKSLSLGYKIIPLLTWKTKWQDSYKKQAIFSVTACPSLTEHLMCLYNDTGQSYMTSLVYLFLFLIKNS